MLHKISIALLFLSPAFASTVLLAQDEEETTVFADYEVVQTKTSTSTVRKYLDDVGQERWRRIRFSNGNGEARTFGPRGQLIRQEKLTVNTPAGSAGATMDVTEYADDGSWVITNQQVDGSADDIAYFEGLKNDFSPGRFLVKMRSMNQLNSEYKVSVENPAGTRMYITLKVDAQKGTALLSWSKGNVDTDVWYIQGSLSRIQMKATVKEYPAGQPAKITNRSTDTWTRRVRKYDARGRLVSDTQYRKNGARAKP